MLFNSLNFAFFLPVVFLFYWFVTNRNLKLQNTLLLISSYFFYASWDYRFLFLLIFSTLLDFYTGAKIHIAKTSISKKIWLWLSIIINLSFLCIFKYYNFFVSSFIEVLSHFNLQANLWLLNIILPVGISFYTFHGLSYVIDIYNNNINPTKDFIEYAVFVSFFPLLVAGPIERATHLLPQIKRTREFEYSRAVDGLRQILWGFFKKIVIADNCAKYVNMVFDNPANYSGSTLVLGAIFFAFQIYGDFSGYSDIALGTARLFGIELLQNFSYPYFSRNIAEFWRRWHISLSSWFRDYLYIPLGGSRGNLSTKIRNTFIVFLVSGIWHGANWTFIIWGILNFLYFLPVLFFYTNRTNLEVVAKGKLFPSIKETLSIIITFCLTTFAWIFFRSNSISQAGLYISNLFEKSLISLPIFSTETVVTIIFVIIFMMIEWFGREQQYALKNIGAEWPRLLRLIMYYAFILIIFYFSGTDQEFIYFQF